MSQLSSHIRPASHFAIAGVAEGRAANGASGGAGAAGLVGSGLLTARADLVALCNVMARQVTHCWLSFPFSVPILFCVPLCVSPKPVIGAIGAIGVWEWVQVSVRQQNKFVR